MRIGHLSNWLQSNVLSLTLGTIIAGSLVAAAPARAETIDELLELLKAKGAITQTEYDKLKARHQAEAKGGEEKLRAAEAKAREAEAKAREAEAKARQEKLRAADMPVPPMAAKAPLQYVTVLTNCVGMRVGPVDICVKGDISFFGIEQFPDKNPNPPTINGGLATAAQNNSHSIRGGLLPSSIQVSLTTRQMGIDIGVYFGVYVGGNNVNWGAFGANNGGNPVSLGTPGVDFRQVYGTLGTPTFGTVKIGRDIGIFAADAILNDLTLFGSGTPAANFAPGNTTLGRIGIGYIYTDFIPQITYTSPNLGGFTISGGIFTPYNEIPFTTGDEGSGLMSGHDEPGFQARLKYVGTFMPNVKLTLSTSVIEQKHQTETIAGFDTTPNGATIRAWGVDGFGRLDVGVFSLVAYGYTGSGIGTTALFFGGVTDDAIKRDSHGGYVQGSVTVFDPLTIGGSWGVSVLEPGGGDDRFDERRLVHKNESWIAFARYKLTDWVKLQAEYVHTRAENQRGQAITDNAVLAGTTFFW
jgi:predicted porin